MSEPEPIDTTDSEDADILLADPEDYHRTQRLREIHEARRTVHEVLREIDAYTGRSEHNSQKGKLAHAVTAYITELEPLIHQADVDETLPEGYPWDTLSEYADMMGYHEKDGGGEIAGYHRTMFVFRRANTILSEIKPLLTEEETREWEV